MKIVEIFGVLALLGSALALPMIDKTTEDDKSSNSLRSEGRIRDRILQQKLLGNTQPFAEIMLFEREATGIDGIKVSVNDNLSDFVKSVKKHLKS